MSPEKKLKNWRLAMGEGVMSAAMTGFTQDYLVPFILLLGSTVRQVSLLSALPNLCAALVQIKGPDIVDFFRSRKITVLAAGLAQAGLLLYLVAAIVNGKITPVSFIFLVVLFSASGALISPPFASMLGDFVVRDKQGDHFGRRNKVLGFVVTFSSLVAGLFLYSFQKNAVLYGFGFLFLGAFLFRTASFYFLLQINEPGFVHRQDDYFTLVQFFRRLRESNFAKFVIFSAAMQFVVNLSSPFFSVLMLRDLKFSYPVYTIVTLASTLTIYLTIQRWGRHADHCGNLRVIRLVSPLLGIVTVLWVFNQRPAYLIFAQIFSGFVWAGYTIATGNFIYDAVSAPKRTRCIAYFNVCNGIAVFAGALTGGFLLSRLPPLFGYPFLTLCVISGVLRVAIGLYLPRLLKEVRSVEATGSCRLLSSMLGFKPR